MNLQTWSPFQSAQVREICANMTPAERSRTVTQSAGYGLWVFATVAGPVAFGWWWSPNILLKVAAAVLLVVHVGGIPFWQRRVRQFLCSTAWARNQGFVPERLRLFRFRFGRRAV